MCQSFILRSFQTPYFRHYMYISTFVSFDLIFLYQNVIAQSSGEMTDLNSSLTIVSA